MDPPTRDLRGLLPRWTAAFVVGELVGFVPPAATGTALAAADVPDSVLIVGLTIAGILEGAALGAAQAVVLRRYSPVSRRRWIGATAAAAAFAWAVGMTAGSLLGRGGEPALWLLVVLGIAVLAALLGMGFAQWLVLRDVAPASGRWIPVTALAWTVGVMFPIAALSLAPDDLPAALRAVVALLGAVLMGVVVGLLTGSTLRQLLARAALRSVAT